MLYALSWFIVVALLALWSLAAWTLHAVAAWALANAGAVSGAGAALGTLRLPAGLVAWMPPQIAPFVSEMLAGLGPLVDGLLQAAPALAGAVTVATWLAWGVGSALLVLLGVALHLLIAWWRRRGGGASGPDARPPSAASEPGHGTARHRTQAIPSLRSPS
jgi:hypothetical protein